MERLHLQDIIQDMEDNFDYKKYLAEGKLLKEEVDVLGNEFLQDIQDTMKMYYKMDVDMDDIKDWVNMYYIGYNSEYDEGPGDVDYEGNEFGSEDYESEKKELVFDTAEREDFYMHLKDDLAEGKQLNENAPGYDTRKFGEALPTLESVKAAHEAKEDDKKNLNETRDEEVQTMASILINAMGTSTTLENLIYAMSTDDAKLYLGAMMRDNDLVMDDEADEDAMASIMMDAPDRY